MMQKIVLKVANMHCSSCAINIDGELEDTNGVKESSTNFAKSQTEVTFETEKIAPEKIVEVIKSLGYEVN